MSAQELIESLQKLKPETEIMVMDSDGYLYEPASPAMFIEFFNHEKVDYIGAAIPIDTTS